MRFDTLGGQCFLAHPTHLLMVMEHSFVDGYGGGEIFSTPESDGVGVDATTTTPSPQESGQKLQWGWGGNPNFPRRIACF